MASPKTPYDAPPSSRRAADVPISGAFPTAPASRRFSEGNPVGPPSSKGRPPVSARRQSLTMPRVDFGLMTPAMRVVDEILAIEPNERMLVAHDVENLDIALAFEHAARERGAEVERIDLEALAPRPWTSCPLQVLARIRESAATVLAVRNEEGEYGVRAELVGAAMAARAKHVHMVGVSRKSFTASLMASCSRVFDLTQTLRKAMMPASKLSVRSAIGTNLEIEMAPHLRWFTNGSVVRRGEWMNVPCGALVSSPAKVSGVYVADAALGGSVGSRTGSLAARPIRLEIEDSRVRRVECSDFGVRLYVEQFLAERKGHERVGLLNLGTNMGIVSPLGEILHDETMPGAHIALGETFSAQTGATWSSYGQLAFAMTNADIDLDGSPLMRRGRYVRYM